MPRGTVKWFDPQKGYGFIELIDGGGDVFVHQNDVEGLGYDEGLRDGELVTFDVEDTPKGLRAVDVQRTGGPT